MSSAARTAKMVKKVAEGEIENTEDPKFKADLVTAKDHVTQCMHAARIHDIVHVPGWCQKGYMDIPC